MKDRNTRAGRKRFSKIDGQFAPRLVEMLQSPAYCELSLSARRVLDRAEIELAKHAGHDNGRLPITYEDFADYGIDRHSVAPGIREATALGFLEITEHGRAGNAEFRAPNKFRVTYRHVLDGAPATHDWRKIKTKEEARAIAKAARKTPTKNKKPVGENTEFGGGNPHRKSESPSGGNHHYTYTGETHTTIDISGRVDAKAA